MDAFDELDFRILRELSVGQGAYFRNERVSLEAIARAVGIHRSTVAARLDRWRAAGALEGFAMDVEPAAFGLVAMHIHLHARTGDVEGAVALAARVEGVQAVLGFDRGWVGVPLMASSEDSLERKVDLLSALFDADAREVVANSREDFPAQRPLDVSPLDARILSALIEDARAAPAEIADACGVTVRTVERRLARLREEGAFFVLPQFRPSRVRGMACGMLCYRLAPDAPRDVVARILDAAPHHHARQVEAPRRGALLLHAENVGGLEAMQKRVETVPGVASATLRLATRETPGVHWNAWLRERVQRHAHG